MFDRLLGRERRIRALRRKGDAAMAARDWISAIRSYQRVLSLRPIPTIQVQLGHALKEAGRIKEALAAYAIVPDKAAEAADARFYQANLLAKAGQKGEALDVLAAILRETPEHRGAFAELVRLGGRDRLPEDFQRHVSPQSIFNFQNDLAHVRTEIGYLEEVNTYPLSAYDAFRHAFPIRPPFENDGTMSPLALLVDGRCIGAAFIRATLLSLIDQTIYDWHADVYVSADMLDHTVSSLAAVDARISFHVNVHVPPTDGCLIHLDAGTILDPNGLRWLRFAALRTGLPVLWCDSDFAAEDENGVLRFRDPSLWGVYDRDIIAQTCSPPPVILVDPSHVSLPPLSLSGPEWRRQALLSAGRAAHVPRILATILRIQDQAMPAPVDGKLALWAREPAGAPPVPGTYPALGFEIVDRGRRPAISVSPALWSDERMTIIIQTRDAGDILSVAVDSLLSKAAEPDRLDLVVVDNRSSDDATKGYLKQISESGRVRIITHDEAFNWSRANNLAVDDLAASYIVFVNNDIEMLTSGWDDLLLGYLQRDDVGVVGARMLYPDGSIQHGGMLFGIGTGGPIHDGVYAANTISGPLDRFDTTRTVPAVTGAFLGVRRALFEAIGGFDEVRLAIGYNDVDFCLAARAHGRSVLYAPSIELIHHESKSRGRNVGRSKVSWDLAEFSALRQRWSKELRNDPGYNPQWSRTAAFDGFREPTLSEILAKIDKSASDNPWKTDCDPPLR